jgi:hypothetical protein
VFWSGRCSHCRRYDDYLNRLPERYPGLGLLAVASRQNESAQMLRATVVERGLRFPLLHDAERAVARVWLVEQWPVRADSALPRHLLEVCLVDSVPTTVTNGADPG